MRIVDHIVEGARIPRGYGAAYRDHASRVVIAYPFGLHLLVRWARGIYFRLASRLKFPRWERKLMDAKQAGLTQGFNQGYRAGFDEAVQEVRRQLAVRRT